MKKVVKKKKSNFFKIISIILLIITIFSFCVVLHFDVLPRTYLFIVLLVTMIIILFIIHKLNNARKNITKIIYLFISLLIIIIEIFINIYAFGTIDFLNNIYDTGYRTNTYNIYVLDKNTKNINELNNKNIGYLKEDENINKALDKLNRKIKYEKKEYNTIQKLLDSIKNKEIDGLFINEAIISAYLDENKEDLKELFTLDVLVKNNSDFKTVDVTKKPFALYISGVDATGKVNKSARSDVNILAVINPNKGKILLINTPRDYYLDLYSKKAKDKLTHAGIYGIEESALSLGLLYDIDVNYYMRINFTSFIKIIDDLGGITLDIDKPDFRYNEGVDCGINYICEQNSKREWDDKTIYIKSGKNIKLNGEQALAYARNRHQFEGGDIARGTHQQKIIKAIIEKAVSSSILTKYNTILKDLSKGLITNIDQKTITKLINYELDSKTKWEIESISAKGDNAYDVCYSLGNAKAFVLKPQEESLTEIKDKIKNILD